LFDEALRVAVADFQNDHHKQHKKKKDAPGHVLPTGDTYKSLIKTRDQLFGTSPSGGGKKKPTVDPAFAAKLGEATSGVANVLSGLNIAVEGQDALWEVGELRGLDPSGGTSMQSGFHWEIFSEDMIVREWEEAGFVPIVDDDDDLVMDATDLIDLIEKENFTSIFQRDRILTQAELLEFYMSGRAEFLRRTQCKFISEWGVDVEATIDKLQRMSDERGLGWDLGAFEAKLRPYLWWDQAADVLPSSRQVWHYNPIEFLGRYAEHLQGLTGDPLSPASEKFGTLIVTVRYSNDEPRKGAVVHLHKDGTKTSGTSAVDGQVFFSGMTPGVCVVEVEGSFPPTLPSIVKGGGR
jgi:hypothetical protein